MNKNTLLFLNNMIYGIYNMKDFEHMKRQFLESLRTLIMFECGSIIMAEDNEKSMLSDDAITIPERYREVEQKYSLMEDYDYSRWHLQTAQSSILRTTDLMSDAEREKTAIYKRCFEPYNLYYSVDISIMYKGRLLGLVALYRQKAQGDFNDREMFMLQLLAEHLNARFYQEVAEDLEPVGERQLQKAALRYGLSERETEIISMITSGMTNDAVSEALAIAPNTLKKHLQHIYAKTGIHSRARLASLRFPEDNQ
jgi:DNA-binding CsgD family transcriptional regulator